jgi:transposase
VDGSVDAVIADGTYDGQPVDDAVAARHPDADVIIPPRSTSVPTETAASQRDRHIKVIQEHSRRGWQRQTGYGRRSLVETAIFRYKTIIGKSLHARTLSNQRTEAKIGCKILNRMTSLGMPVSVRIK